MSQLSHDLDSSPVTLSMTLPLEPVMLILVLKDIFQVLVFGGQVLVLVGQVVVV